MSATTTIEISLPAQLAERLDDLARRTERRPEDVAAEALTAFLDDDAWQVEAIAAAIATADAGGPFVAHEEVERWLASWGTENEGVAPEPTVRR